MKSFFSRNFWRKQFRASNSKTATSRFSLQLYLRWVQSDIRSGWSEIRSKESGWNGWRRFVWRSGREYVRRKTGTGV